MTVRDFSRPWMTMAVFLIAWSPAFSAVPAQVAFQGSLRNSAGTPMPDGTYTVRFTLFNGPSAVMSVVDERHTFSQSIVTLLHNPVVSGSETVAKAGNGTLYVRGTHYSINNTAGVITSISIPAATSVRVSYNWVPTEQWQEIQDVVVKGGLFAARLGSVTPLSTSVMGAEDALEVAVKNGAVFERLNPRMPVTSAPSALRVGTVDGASGGDITGSLNLTGSIEARGSRRSDGPTLTVGPGVRAVGGELLGLKSPGLVAEAAGGAGTAIVSDGDLVVIGNGRIQAKGALEPDISVAGVMASSTSEASVSYTSLGASSNIVVIVEQIFETFPGLFRYGPPRSFTYTYGSNIIGYSVELTRNTGVTSDIRYRVRIWKTP